LRARCDLGKSTPVRPLGEFVPKKLIPKRMHVLPLFGRNAVGSTVSVLFHKDILHVEATGVARLVRVGNQMPNPAKRDGSVSRWLRLVRENPPAEFNGL
jgi:hypothetical protein